MRSEEHISEILNENKRIFVEFKTKRNLTRALEFRERTCKRLSCEDELLELLQNVDDAYEELCQQDSSKRGEEVEAFIEYTGSTLCIQNNRRNYLKYASQEPI